MGSSYSLFMYPDTTPMGDSEPTFDPMYGFPNGRKTRAIKATEQQIIAQQVETEYRDFCVDYYIEVDACRRHKAPFVWRCGQEVHNFNLCAYEDYTMRMKEYERERRLLERQKRKREREAAAA